MLAHLRIMWRGDLRPTIVTQFIGFAPDVVQMSSMTSGAAVGVMLYRDGQDIDDLAEIAAELEHVDGESAQESVYPHVAQPIGPIVRNHQTTP